MEEFKPKNPEYLGRVKESFERQVAMKTLHIGISSVDAGRVELTMPFRADFTQQHGFIHAGIITTALDSACGYAAFSLMPEDAAVLTVEFKTNLMAPAKGDLFRFKAKVIRPGRTLTFCDAQAFAVDSTGEKLIATMSATLMAVVGREEIKG